MKDPIKLIKLGWKTGLSALVVTTMVLGGLVLNLKAASAAGTPNMTVRHEGLIGANGNWSHNVTLNPGDEVQFYAEVHNTVVGTTADNVTLKANVTGGTFTDGTSVATASANNANSASDTVNIHINGGGRLEFIEHTTRVTWDVNGDGTKEFDLTRVAGNPTAGSGLLIGDQNGCNEFIIQVYWAMRVIQGEQPSPTPTPTPPAGGQNQEQNQNQDQDVKVEQNNNQTVNITNPPAVAGVSVPVKQPETGVSVLGMGLMAGAAPVGFVLSRFGKGRITGKREESLEETAMGIISKRLGKNTDA